MAAPGESGRGNIRQGMLEASNVNVVEELVDMIECQRAYEINSKMISAVDEMLRNANQTTVMIMRKTIVHPGAHRACAA